MKRFLCLSLIFLLALSLLPAGALAASGEMAPSAEPAPAEKGIWSFEAEGLSICAPGAYVDADGLTTGVINGYYSQTAPILLFANADDDLAGYLSMGYVCATAAGDDLASLQAAAEYLAAEDAALPGDAGRIIAVGSTAAAELAARGGYVYAADIKDPIVKAEASEEAIEAALGDSAKDLAMSFAEISITEASNYASIEMADAEIVEETLEGVADFEWTEGTSSGEPTGKYASVEASVVGVPNALAIPADAAEVKPGAGAASYVRIGWNMDNSDSAYTAAIGLAEIFEQAGVVAQLNLIWDDKTDTEEAFCEWVDRICKFEHEFSTEEIETTLDLGNALVSGDAKWELSATGACYVLSSDRYIGVVDVARPELPRYQGVSVAVPAAYVNGINPDGTLDINWEAEITNSNGMTYTAATAPIVMQTGATGYSVKENYLASTGSTGFITVEPGNRGKYSQAYDARGDHYYTGDAPLCSTDQRSTVRWLRYNHSLGYIPGDIDRIVTWGGSGGGAHATLICAGDSPYYAPYLYDSGALGVECVNGDCVYLDGFSDAVWGSCPGGAVTNLEEANMLYEFETWLSTPTDEVLLTLDDGTKVYVPANLSKFSDFYKLLSYYMVMEFVDYFNAVGLSCDIDGDGKAEELTLGYDPARYPETSGLYGSYVDFFKTSAEAQLEWYLDNIDAATNNTYLNENGESDVEAFLNGHYTYISMAMGPDAKTGDQPGIDLLDCLVESWSVDEEGRHEVEFKSIGHWEVYRGRTKTPLAFDSMSYCTENEVFGDAESDYRHWDKYCLSAMTKHYDELEAVYTENDSSLYDTFEELYESFANDCIEIVLGQEQSGRVTGENIEAVLNTLNYVQDGSVSHDAVWVYNPMNLFLDGTAVLPTWVWTVTGAADSDSSNLVSLNDAVALDMGGVDASFAWTWGAGHGASTPLNTSQNGTIDAMMAKYAD